MGRFDTDRRPAHDTRMNTPQAPGCSSDLTRLLRLLAFDAPPSREELAAWPEAAWLAIAQAAERERLSPLLYYRLADARAPAPDAVLARLRRQYLQVAADNTRRFAALEEALDALQAEGVPVILLKGAHLAPLVYDNIALRPMVDLDLLVRDGDAQRALETLSSLGYAPLAEGAWMEERYGHHGLRRGDGVLLELHQRLGAMAVGAKIDQTELWRRAIPAAMGHTGALALDPTDLVLHLCTHAAQQHLLRMGLLPVYDIGQVLAHEGARLAAEALVQRAREWHVSRATFLMLELARRLFRAPMGAIPLGALNPPDGEAHVAQAKGMLLSATEPENTPSSNLVALWSEPRWRVRLTMLLRILLPPAERMRSLYRVPADRPVAPWLYLRRWADLLTQRRASVRQWVGRSSEGTEWQSLVRWLAEG